MKKLKLTKRGITFLLVTAMIFSLVGCGKSGNGNKVNKDELKNLVYKGERLSCMDQIEGDLNSYCVTDDSIYMYTVKWPEEPISDMEDGLEGDVGTNVDADTNTDTDSDTTDSVKPEARDTADEAETPEDGDATDEAETPEDGDAADEAETPQDGDAADEAETPEDGDTADEAETPQDGDAADDSKTTDAAENTEEPATDEAPVEEDIQAEEHLYVCGIDGSNLKEIKLPQKTGKNEWVNYICASNDGSIYFLYNSYDDKTEKNLYVIKVIDKDGNPKTEMDVSDIFAGEDTYFGGMKLDKDNNIYLTSEQYIYVRDKDGNKLYDQKSDNWIMGIAMTKEGNMIVCESGEKGISIKALDNSKKGFGQEYKMEDGFNANSFMNGSEYSFYYSNGTSLYGYDIATGKSKEILNWVCSNINTNMIQETQALSDGRFVTNYNDYNSSDKSESGIYIFKKVDPSEVADKTIITYAGLYVDDSIKTQAIKFNKSQDKYQVVVQDYSGYDDALTKMNADLLAGNVPDIIDLSGLSSDKYIAKGMLDDLYTFMEKDPDIKKEDFQENILKVMETNGKLYHITPSFGANVVVAKNSDLGGKKGLTMQDLMDLEKSKPEGTKAFYMSSKNGILSQICSADYTDYIDWNTGKCSFNSDEFIKVLEYANTYPNDDEIDWSADVESMSSMIRSGKILFAEAYSISFEEIELYDKMFDSDEAFIGYPSANGLGASMNMNMDIGIYAKSKNKDGAWNFLKNFLTEEYISNNKDMYYGGFPLRKDCMENELKKYTTKETYKDKYGNEIAPLDSEWGYDDMNVKIGPLNDKQVQQVKDLIASVDHLNVYNDEIMTIITEEAGPYFSGQKSSKEVADIIQNRISTYVNENR